MKSENVPHGSFREGFAVGCQLIMGTAVEFPAAPGGYAPFAGSTSFLEGIKAGIEAAGGA